METTLPPPAASWTRRRRTRGRRGRSCRAGWLAAIRCLAAILCLVAGGPRATAADACPPADVWVASTRRLPGACRPPEHVAFDVERLTGAGRGRWERAGLEDLLASADRPLVLFIHGNRYAAGEAKDQGVRLARVVAAACPDAGPVRTVVFSWPSEQRNGLLRDARAKYARAHADGHHLASLLAHVGPDRDVALVGYSYGAIIALQALEDLATGQVAAGPAAERQSGRTGRTHLVLVAPAVRTDALAPRGAHRAALAGVDRFTLVVNSSDYALRFFHVIDPEVRTTALGSAGMPRRWLPADLEYSAVDAAGLVGTEHSLVPYLDCGPLARRIGAGAVSGCDTCPAR